MLIADSINMKRTVMVDLDGVLAKFTDEFKRRAEEELGRSLANITEWDFAMKQWGMSDEWFSSRMHEWTADGMFRDLEAYPGAISAVKELMRNDLYVHFYTSRPDNAAADTCIWLSRHFGAQAKHWGIEMTNGLKVGGHRFIAAIDDFHGNIHSLSSTGCPQASLCRRPWSDTPEAISLEQFVTNILGGVARNDELIQL